MRSVETVLQILPFSQASDMQYPLLSWAMALSPTQSPLSHRTTKTDNPCTYNQTGSKQRSVFPLQYRIQSVTGDSRQSTGREALC